MLVLLTFGGGGGDVVQNRASPDYRSPEVGRYVLVSDHLPQATPIQTPKFPAIVATSHQQPPVVSKHSKCNNFSIICFSFSQNIVHPSYILLFRFFV